MLISKSNKKGRYDINYHMTYFVVFSYILLIFEQYTRKVDNLRNRVFMTSWVVKLPVSLQLFPHIYFCLNKDCDLAYSLVFVSTYANIKHDSKMFVWRQFGNQERLNSSKFAQYTSQKCVHLSAEFPLCLQKFLRQVKLL